MEKSNDILMREHHKLRISKTTLPDQAAQNYQTKSPPTEESFHAVINQFSREMTFVIKLDGEISFCNAAVKSILGFEASALMNRNIKHIIPVDQWTVFRAALHASETESLIPTIIDCEFLDADNQKIFCSLSVRDERYHPLVGGYIIQVQNISRLQKTEEKLMLHKLANELIKEAVVIVDVPKMKVVFANQAFYHLSGFSKAEVMEGKLNLFKSPYSDLLFAAKTPLKQIERFQKALQARKKFVGKIYSKKKSGKVFYHRFDLSPVVNSKGELTHYIAGMKEIKQRKSKAKQKS
jgi:PAS domain S-box-containing protein